MRRVPCSDWPRILCPEVGCYPPAAEWRTDERVLHLAMYPGEIGRLRLDSIATAYRMVHWPGKISDAIAAEACAAAREIRPTLVFMQLQGPGVLEPRHVDAIRTICDPSVVVVNWDGDQHYEATDPERTWFVELGRVCDASLVVNTEHPAVYAHLGVRHPGFLEIAVDPSIFHVAPPAPDVPPVVLLANATHAVHAARAVYVPELDREFGPRRFGVYGSGWNALASGRRPLGLYEESPVYAAARAALSISARNDLPRYTSDRLFRLLASGAVPVVERFPDCEGLGVTHGVNCFLWSGANGLRKCVRTVLALTDPERQEVRAAAADLGCAHTWPERLPELLALVDAVRRDRQPH